MTKPQEALRVIDSLSSPGAGVVNEDLVGWNKQTCWVLDGTTPVTPSRLARSDARWLVEQVDSLLRSGTVSDAVLRDVPSGIGQVAKTIDSRLKSRGFPADALPPACSMGIVVSREEGVELAIVGDVTIYVPSQNQLLNDHRFGRNESNSRRRHGNATLASESVRDDIAERRKRYIDGPGAMYVLSRNPRVAWGVHRMTVEPQRDPFEILMMSDGFARLVESYDLFEDYAKLTGYVREAGLSSALALLRSYEMNHASESNFKRADDATAALMVVNPTRMSYKRSTNHE